MMSNFRYYSRSRLHTSTLCLHPTYHNKKIRKKILKSQEINENIIKYKNVLRREIKRI